MIEEEIRRGTKSKEEITVLNDLLRLDVRRLRDLLSSKSDVVFSLENRRQQMMLSLEERKQEIAVHRDLLKAELRARREEKHAITLDLRNREMAVEKLKARFDAVTNAKGGKEEGVSQSHFIILAAQKREELQRKGDDLDANIRKTEKELRALQATLDHLNVRNTAYRESFQKVSLDGNDFEVLKQLEERNKMSKDNMFRKKKELQRLATDYDEDTRRLELIRNKAGRADKQKQNLENAKSQIQEELLTQQGQLDELQDKVEKVVDKHRSSVSETQMDLGGEGDSMLSIEEKAVKAEVYRDVVQVSTLI
jgi:chromosome segregation ATPase